MIKKQRELLLLARCDLAATVFVFSAAPTSVSAQTKEQLQEQFVKTAAQLRGMAWNSSCSSDSTSEWGQIESGGDRIYNHVRPHQALGMRPPVPETIYRNA